MNERKCLKENNFYNDYNCDGSYFFENLLSKNLFMFFFYDWFWFY